MTLTYSQAVHAVTGEPIDVTETRLEMFRGGQWVDKGAGPANPDYGDQRTITRPCSWALILPSDQVLVHGSPGTVAEITYDGYQPVGVELENEAGAFGTHEGGIVDTFTHAELTLVIDPDNPPEHRKGHPAWVPNR